MTKTTTGFRLDTAANLAECQAFGAAADRHRRVNPITMGEFVVALCKRTDGTYLAMGGVATGRFLDTPATEIWCDFDTQGKEITVHQVRWITAPMLVPADIAAAPGHVMGDTHATQIMEYLIDRI